MNRVDVYAQRMLDASAPSTATAPTSMLKSEKGWMVMVRTYPRHPFWEETNESKPMWTRTGRYENYRIEPEAIEYGENFIFAPGRARSDAVSAERDLHHQSLHPAG